MRGHEVCITHLIFNLGDLFLSVIDVGHVLPVLHHAHEELGVPGLPVVQSSPDDPLLVVITAGPVFPYLERPSNSLEVGASECVGHATLTCLLQLLRTLSVASRFISNFFGKITNLVVLDCHLVSEHILLLLQNLHLHEVSTIHPRAESTLLHPMVHLAKNDLRVSLRFHIDAVVGADRIKALAHQSAV